MLALRRKAVQSAKRLPAAARRGTQRYSTGQHGKTGDEVHHFAGSSTEHGHHSAGPQAESLGMGFYIILAAIPTSIAVYTFSRPDKDGNFTGITSLMKKYSDMQEEWTARNTLHTKALEEAAFQRNLFQSEPGSRHINLRFPEIFNTGSPYNVPAGHRARNMEELVAHYEKVNADDEQRKLKALAAKEE